MHMELSEGEVIKKSAIDVDRDERLESKRTRQRYQQLQIFERIKKKQEHTSRDV